MLDKEPLAVQLIKYMLRGCFNVVLNWIMINRNVWHMATNFAQDNITILFHYNISLMETIFELWLRFCSKKLCDRSVSLTRGGHLVYLISP